MNILFLATDAYGGYGGIGYYNRCLAEALAQMPQVREVTLLPRLVPQSPDNIPAKVDFVTGAAGGKFRYLSTLAWQLARPCHLVICGHINLLPLAIVVSTFKRAPLVLQVHGIDVWQPPGHWIRYCVNRVSGIWSVSRVTRDRMNDWAKLPLDRYTVIPNTLHLEQYGMAPKRADLVHRFGLEEKSVILTLARLDARERYKGIDEILEVLPKLVELVPRLCYLIAGDGNDKYRLQTKVRELGVSDHVVFAGYVAESDKADLIRLADVFAMPGRGEGFGIVYLEAMACGVPVMGSQLDGSRDALKDGELGLLVNPDDPANLKDGLLKALNIPKHIPDGLQDFAWPAFAKRVSNAVLALVSDKFA